MAIGAIGEAARQFSQGFLQARQLKAQKSQQSAAAKQFEIDGLSKMMDQTNDPNMKTILFETIAQKQDELVAALEGRKPGSGSKKGGGLGAMFKSFFGFGGGGDDAGGQTEGRESPSGTFGGVLEQYRSATGMAPGGEARKTEGLPPPPSEEPVAAASPTFGSMSHLFGDASARMTPAEPKPTIGPAMSTPSSPATPPASPVVTAMETQPKPQPQATRTPQQIIEDARQTNNVGYFGLDQTAFNEDVKRQAAEAVQEIQDVMDAYLDLTPGADTYESASQNRDFRRGLDNLRAYETSGLVPKGFLDDYLKTRFAEFRTGYSGARPDAQEQFALEVQPLFLRDPNTWTPEEKTKVEGYSRFLEAGRASNTLSAEQQLEADAIAELRSGTTNGTAMRAYRTFKGIGTTPASQRVQSIREVRQPGSPISKLAIFYEDGSNKMTDLEVPPNVSPSRWMGRRIVEVPAADFAGRPMPPERKEVDAIDPALIITDHVNGVISDQFLEDFIVSGALQDPKDRQQLQDYITKLKQNPLR